MGISYIDNLIEFHFVILYKKESKYKYIVFMNNYRGRKKYIEFYWLKSLES